ncbi:hypothetical protein CR513_50437, partial [Mucuna pruriens]
MDRSMIDAASGGALMDKTPATARHLISNMASNTQQFGIRGPSQSQMMVNEIGAASNLRLENQLSELTSLVRQLAVGQHQPNMAAKVCETESNQPENVGAIGGYQHGKQPYQNRPFDNQQYGRQPFLARTKSRALCSLKIQTYTECTSRISKLPTTESAILSTTFPTVATIKNATTRQFSISRGPD